MFFHNLPLSGSSSLQRDNSQPRTLSLLDISPFLSGYRRVPKTVKEVILDLEKLTHLQQNSLGLSVLFLVSHSRKVHGQSHGHLKTVVRGLVFHNRRVSAHREHIQLRFCVAVQTHRVQTLAQCRFKGDVVEEFHQLNVRRMVSEISANEYY